MWLYLKENWKNGISLLWGCSQIISKIEMTSKLNESFASVLVGFMPLVIRCKYGNHFQETLRERQRHLLWWYLISLGKGMNIMYIFILSLCECETKTWLQVTSLLTLWFKKTVNMRSKREGWQMTLVKSWPQWNLFKMLIWWGQDFTLNRMKRFSYMYILSGNAKHLVAEIQIKTSSLYLLCAGSKYMLQFCSSTTFLS